ncbi:MAG: hypothetical protein J7502_14250, partial [Flavisolibacter sp.]|nr:hypothetical protein [Flavisolibacter sp.]
MKNYITLSMCLLLFRVSFTQNTVFSYQPAGAAVTKPSPYYSYVANDKKNLKTTMLLWNSDQVEYILLSKDFEQEGIIQVPRASSAVSAKDYGFYAAIINNTTTSIFYSTQDKSLNNNKRHFRIEIADFKNKTVTNKFLFEKPEGETIKEWFVTGGNFVVLATNDKEKQLIFHIADEKG